MSLKLLIGMERTGNAYQYRLLAHEVTAAARHGRCKQWNLCVHSGGTASNRSALLHCGHCLCLIWLHTSESRGGGREGKQRQERGPSGHPCRRYWVPAAAVSAQGSEQDLHEITGAPDSWHGPSLWETKNDLLSPQQTTCRIAIWTGKMLFWI